MKLDRLEQLPQGLVKFFLRIEKESLVNRCASIALLDASQMTDETEKQTKEDRWARVVNECILSEFPPIFESQCQKYHWLAIGDPDFELLTFDLTQDMQVVAQLQIMPPLSLGQYFGFTQAVEDRQPREVQRLLYINQHFGEEARQHADDAQAMALLHQKAEQALIEKGHPLAVQLAQQKLIHQLGLQVTGELPEELCKEYYYKEKQRFGIQMQSQKLNLDVYLEQRGQTIEAFRAEMHRISEQKLRAQLGLLLVAQKENLQPTAEQVQTAFEAWLETKPKTKTFEANDRHKIYLQLCRENATKFILEHSVLIGR